jgi:glycerate kinase
MRILIAPNAFKETLSANQVADLLEIGILETCPEIDIEKVRLADGGDGTLEVLTSFWGGSIRTFKTLDPLNREIEAPVGFDRTGRSAVIEMALVSGLALLEEREKDPFKTSTLGLGMLIAGAVQSGAETIYLGIGGSATVDGGVGMGEGLGFRHLDASRKAVRMGGRHLPEIDTIIPPQNRSPQLQTKVTILSDVSNPLCGERGAARVFGPQKGATSEQVEFLDKGLHHLAEVWKRDLGKDVAEVPGAGAAGGVGAGAIVYLNAELVSGADRMLEITDLSSRIASSQLVITGEGRLDLSTLEGKLPGKVARMAKKAGVPCVGLYGLLDRESEEALRGAGFTDLVPVAPEDLPPEEKMRNAEEFMLRTGRELGKRLDVSRGVAPGFGL